MALIWATFGDLCDDKDEEEEEEKLSFSDLPVISGDTRHHHVLKQEESDDTRAPAIDDEDFEFRIFGGGGGGGGGGGLLQKAEEDGMCAADDVFFKGQILPLRPSLSSDCVQRCGSSSSRSDSMDCRSSVAASGFGSSRSGSTSSSSSGGFISRSHSTSSAPAGGCDAPRHSVSNNFYAHPSPTPQVRNGGGAGRRRSTGSPPPGWGLFRLGVVKAPEIELSELRSRRASGGGGISRKPSMEPKREKMKAFPPRRSCSDVVSGMERDVKKETRVMRFMGKGLGCRCSPDAVKEAAAAAATLHVRKEEEVEKPRLKRGESTCRRRRIFEWLEELSVSKASMGG